MKIFYLTTGLILAMNSAFAREDTIQGFANKLFASDQFNAEVERQKTRNASIAKSVNDQIIDRAKQELLPKLNQAGSEMKYGNHNIVSQDGESVILMIRSLTSSDKNSQIQTLKKLQDLSNRSNPEALNFFGFINEHGLFGARKNVVRALQFYEASAQYGYQPALYNTALMLIYSKAGRQDFNKAFPLLQRAISVAPESSYRVCGMTSFLAYRLHLTSANFSKSCASSLASIAIGASSTSITDQLLENLRKSFGAGVDDGIYIIERLTSKNTESDNQFLYCKYALVRKYLEKTDLAGIKDDAMRCVYKSTQQLMIKDPQRQQYIQGVLAFVPTEIGALKTIRTSNHFHYSWGVPYLPFGQTEVDLFEPHIK